MTDYYIDEEIVEGTQEERPAGFWLRLAANIVDSLLVAVPLSFLGAVITLFFFGLDSFLLGETIVSNIINFILFIYMLFLPVLWKGYVVGKRMCGVRIIRMDGGNVTIVNMLLRNVVGGLVYLLTLGIGVVVSAFMVGLREDKRSIHDFISGTQVVKKQ